MQANDDNENEDDALEVLALLEQQDPYQGAPIHRQEQFLNSTWSKKRRVSYTSKEAYSMLEGFVSNKLNV